MKFFKILGVSSLMFFSFYYVERVSNMLLYKNNLYQEIISGSAEYEVPVINAIIENENITPGIYGKKVNELDSYYKMKAFKKFNEHFLIYDSIKPDISLEDNKDKIIISGNNLNNQISFIVDNDLIKDYMLNNNIPGDILVTYDTFKENSFFEQINNDFSNYKRTENIFKKNNAINELCFYTEKIKNLCLQHHKYLIGYTKILNYVNYVKIKANIYPGDIYYINHDANLEDFKLLVKEIKFKNLDIVYLSELIKEQRD